MTRTILSLCALLFVALTNAEEPPVIEEGTFLLHGRNTEPKPFSVTRIEDKWEIKSADPSFPLRLIYCHSNCDFRLMPENLQQRLFPQFKKQFAMSCIANSGFALCKMMSKPLLQCGSASLKAGEACGVSSDLPGKHFYGLFALFAPGVMPISVTREETK